MPPPKHLVEYWKKNPSWPKRYLQTSAELNWLLCGIPHNKEDSLWTPTAVNQFNTFMEKESVVITKPITLYRGTSVPSPTMSPLANIMVSCQYMSTTKSRAIADEFNWKKKGYIHILELQPGVRVYDFINDYGDAPVKREQEVLILPGHILTISDINGHTMTWKVSKRK